MQATLENRVKTIEVGDFIRARDVHLCCGIVEKVGTIRFGKVTMRGYLIRKGNGCRDFIPVGEAEFIG